MDLLQFLKSLSASTNKSSLKPKIEEARMAAFSLYLAGEYKITHLSRVVFDGGGMGGRVLVIGLRDPPHWS